MAPGFERRPSEGEFAPMHLIYLSTDEMNRSLVRGWAGSRGVEVECPLRVDRSGAGWFDAVLVDLDHATAEWIGTLADWLGAARGRCVVALHGYGAAADADAFRGAFPGREVTVHSRLRPELLRGLARDAGASYRGWAEEEESDTLTWVD